MRRIAAIVFVGLAFIWFGACRQCSAQQIIGRPMLALQTPSSLPVGMKHWWKSTDLAASPVGTWTDSVSSFNLVQTTAGSKPTWASGVGGGVTFDGTDDSLDITNIISGQSTSFNRAWLIVLKWNSVVADKMVIADRLSGGAVFVGIGDPSTPLGLYDGTLQNAVNPIGTQVFDIIICNTTNTVNWRVYTNGVSAWSGVNGFNASITLNHVGSGSGNAFWSGTMKEIVVWTNVIFTASQISDIHYYATNRYTFTP